MKTLAYVISIFGFGSNKKLYHLTTCILCLFLFNTALSKDSNSSVFGKGIEFGSKDSSFYMKFSSRVQSRFDGIFIDDENSTFIKEYRFRRARFKFDGFAFTPKLAYKVEYDLVNSLILDAVIKWNFVGNFDFWIGRAKLPGNRERLISSQKLQFVDRSLLNSKFNIDRDDGIQLRHHFQAGNWLIREAFSISKGEGRIYTGENFGNDYTARIEFLPFGEFAGKGDYSAADLKREPEPKLAMGITYGYNDNAIKSRGQMGSVLSETRDLKTVFVDMMYKHNGLSIMAEYANKKIAKGTPVIFNTDGNLLESFYTGSAVNTQIGYLFNDNWEVSGRFTSISPQRATMNNDLTEYTIGLSKYIVGHNLKVQTDFSILREDNEYDKKIFRLQLELAF